MDFLHGASGGESLLCENGGKCSDHRAVDGAAVVEGNAKYFL